MRQLGLNLALVVITLLMTNDDISFYTISSLGAAREITSMLETATISPRHLSKGPAFVSGSQIAGPSHGRIPGYFLITKFKHMTL